MPLDLKNALTEKIGPLPGAAWAGIGAVGFILLRHKKAATTAGTAAPGTGGTVDANGNVSGAIPDVGYGTSPFSVLNPPDTTNIPLPPGVSGGATSPPQVDPGVTIPAPTPAPAAPNPAPAPTNNNVIDLSTVNLIGTVVDEMTSPNGGVWVLTSAGCIYSFNGAQYYGGACGKSYFIGRTAKKLLPNGMAYTIVATSGETYNYPGP
jgi:hypothetical protein